MGELKVHGLGTITTSSTYRHREGKCVIDFMPCLHILRSYNLSCRVCRKRPTDRNFIPKACYHDLRYGPRNIRHRCWCCCRPESLCLHMNPTPPPKEPQEYDRSTGTDCSMAPALLWPLHGSQDPA